MPPWPRLRGGIPVGPAGSSWGLETAALVAQFRSGANPRQSPKVLQLNRHIAQTFISITGAWLQNISPCLDSGDCSPLVIQCFLLPLKLSQEKTRELKADLLPGAKKDGSVSARLGSIRRREVFPIAGSLQKQEAKMGEPSPAAEDYGVFASR